MTFIDIFDMSILCVAIPVLLYAFLDFAIFWLKKPICLDKKTKGAKGISFTIDFLISDLLRGANCPCCGDKMKLAYHSKTVNTNKETLEMQNKLFVCDLSVTGDVKLQRSVFYCEKCGKELSKKELRKVRAENKKSKIQK